MQLREEYKTIQKKATNDLIDRNTIFVTILCESLAEIQEWKRTQIKRNDGKVCKKHLVCKVKCFINLS